MHSESIRQARENFSYCYVFWHLTSSRTSLQEDTQSLAKARGPTLFLLFFFAVFSESGLAFSFSFLLLKGRWIWRPGTRLWFELLRRSLKRKRKISAFSGVPYNIWAQYENNSHGMGQFLAVKIDPFPIYISFLCPLSELHTIRVDIGIMWHIISPCSLNCIKYHRNV